MSQTVAQPAVSFAEIRHLILHLPRLDPVVLPDMPSCGKLAEWIDWLARAQGGKPTLQRMRLAIYAGAHGCAVNSAQETRAQLEALTPETSPLVRVVQAADADLRVYELDLDSPTADFRQGAALTEEAVAHAMAYGMMAVEPGLHLLALAGFGVGGEEAYAALREALHTSDTPLEALAQYGGVEVCAIVGALLAARLAKVPVLLDGGAAAMAAEIVAKLSRDALSHCASAQAMDSEVTGIGLASALSLSRLKGVVALAG